MIASLPFNITTALLRALLDDPSSGPGRADVIVQKEVARKRIAAPPDTLLSTAWPPWWKFEIVRAIPRDAFRPVPKVDAAWLAITARNPPVLPPAMAAAYKKFVCANWQKFS